MRDLKAYLIAIGIGLAMALSIAGLSNLANDFGSKELDVDRLNMISALNTYETSKGEYPIGDEINKLKRKDKAQNEIEKKISKGKIKDATILQDIVEVNQEALRDSVKLSKNDKWFMIKGDPSSVFSWRIARRDNFTLVNGKKLLNFSNTSIVSKNLVIENKRMNVVNSACKIDDSIFIGGQGEFILAKIIDGKPSIIDKPALAGFVEVKYINSEYIIAVKSDGKLQTVPLESIK